jgi:hypothetical protein
VAEQPRSTIHRFGRGVDHLRRARQLLKLRAQHGGLGGSGTRRNHSALVIGRNFTGVTRVLFNGVEAKFTTRTNTDDAYDLRFIAVVPANATTGPVTIETPHGHFTTTTNFEVVRSEPPLAPGIQHPATGPFQLTAPALSTGFVLESAASLAPPALWTPIFTNPANNALLFTDPDAARLPQRFYRAVIR